MSSFKDYLNTYVFETELPGSGDTISFKPVTTGQIKKLLLYETSNDPMSIEDSLDDLINECVIKPNDFDVRKLYLQDRFYLLVEIRKATRGNLYGFQTECTSCGSQTQQMLKLSELTVTTLTKKVEKKSEEVINKQTKKRSLVEKKKEYIKVPTISIDGWDIVKLNDNISVRLSLVTRNMQKQAIDMINDKHKGEDISEIQKTLELTTVLYGLSIKSIITPEGEEDNLPLEDKIFLLDNIQQSEQEKISEWYDKNEFGIDFSFDVECAQCHYKEKKAVPVENFFY